MHRTTRRGATALAPVLALFLAACGGGNDTPASSSSEGDVVELIGVDFVPEELTVEAGTTVTWRWVDRLAHDVVGDDFASPVQPEGEFTHTFDEPGEYDYVCRLHPGMDGTIIVE